MTKPKQTPQQAEPIVKGPWARGHNPAIVLSDDPRTDATLRVSASLPPRELRQYSTELAARLNQSATIGLLTSKEKILLRFALLLFIEQSTGADRLLALQLRERFGAQTPRGKGDS